MKKRLLAVITLICLIVTTNAAAVGIGLNTNDPNTMLEFYKIALKYTAKNYHFGVTYEELIDRALLEYFTENPDAFDTFMKYAYEALDENSHYYAAEEYETISEETSGKYAGIGVQINKVNNSFYVGEPFKDSPAEIAGFRANDVIVAIDDQDVTGWTIDHLVSLIRGETGTTVKITVERGGMRFDLYPVRDQILVNPVEYYSLGENNAGYIRLKSFNGNADLYVTEALNALSKEGVDKVVLDLRDNLGGYVKEAIGIASHFLKPGSVVLGEYQAPKDYRAEYKSVDTGKRYKVVVLVNEYSASASEIVAGAIQQNLPETEGVLIGRTTFGKGTVQTTLPLKNDGAIWLTVAEYTLPDGTCIHKKGIVPDEYVINRSVPLDRSTLPSVKMQRTLKNGDKGEDVLAIKEYLSAWGYQFSNMNDEYDLELERAVMVFQSAYGLFPYGVADITTQIKMVEASFDWKVEKDSQLERAKEIIFKM